MDSCFIQIMYVLAEVQGLMWALFQPLLKSVGSVSWKQVKNDQISLGIDPIHKEQIYVKSSAYIWSQSWTNRDYVGHVITALFDVKTISDGCSHLTFTCMNIFHQTLRHCMPLQIQYPDSKSVQWKSACHPVIFTKFFIAGSRFFF